MKVLYIPRKGILPESVASFIFLLRSGSKDDPQDKAELHHLCEHLVYADLDKTKYPLFTIFRTTMEYTIFQFVFPAQHLADCVRQISTRLWNPCIPVDRFSGAYREILAERERRLENFTYDFAFQVAQAYWNAPRTCKGLHLSDVNALIAETYHNSHHHVVSYTGPQDGAEVMRTIRCQWRFQSSTDEAGTTPARPPTREDMKLCWYHQGANGLTFFLAAPGYKCIPDYHYRLITDFLSDIIYPKAYQHHYQVSHKRLYYPDMSFLMVTFQGHGEETEAIAIVKDALQSLYVGRDDDRLRWESFLHARELEWMIRYESTLEVAREQTCRAFRGEDSVTLAGMLDRLRRCDLGEYRVFVDLFLSHFMARGRVFEKVTEAELGQFLGG